jgi:Xaa-Pro aminopeptidase
LIEVSMLSEGQLDWLNAYHARVASEVHPHLDDATKTWLDQATAPLHP